MFLHATSFNQPLYNWNISSMIDMFAIFEYAKSFNYLGSTSKGRSSLLLWQKIYPNIDLDDLNAIKDYIEPLTRDKLNEILQDRKPILDSSDKENFLKTRRLRSRNTLKRYKQLVDRISDYMYTNNIDLNSSEVKIVYINIINNLKILV